MIVSAEIPISVMQQDDARPVDRQKLTVFGPERRSMPAQNPAASRSQIIWLRRGLGAPGRKLPLFDRNGRGVPRRMIEACIKAGWAEPWFSNPLKPDWLVCRLTESGREMADMAHGRRHLVLLDLPASFGRPHGGA